MNRASTDSPVSRSLMFQCDAESSRRTLTKRCRINIPGRSSNISIIVQAIDSIFMTPEVEKNYVFSIRHSSILALGFHWGKTECHSLLFKVVIVAKLDCCHRLGGAEIDRTPNFIR
jgi:hypothetical protein